MTEIVARAHRDGSLRPDATAMDVTWLIEQFSRRPPASPDPAAERNVRARLVARSPSAVNPEIQVRRAVSPPSFL